MTQRTDTELPRFPRRIALVSPAGDEAADLLLGDFADALRAYCRVSSYSGDADGGGMPELVRMTAGRGRNNASEDKPYDTVVAAATASVIADNGSAEWASRLVTPSGACEFLPGARLYAIVAEEPGAGDNSALDIDAYGAAAIKLACDACGLTWCGVLLAGRADVIRATKRSPRMGAVRRPLSEAIDRLIYAVRCGESAGTITVPATFWRTVRQRMLDLKGRS